MKKIIMDKFEKQIKMVQLNPEFLKLKNIGGHTVYHLEGNAYEHSLLVYNAAKDLFPGNSMMQLTALIHDIGKIYTSVQNDPDNPNDWSYPNHSAFGAQTEILKKFIPLEWEEFPQIQWYIKNHIKPLFWKTEKDAEKLLKNIPEGCFISDLAKLGLCDLTGSHNNGDPKIVHEDAIIKSLLLKISKKPY